MTYSSEQLQRIKSFWTDSLEKAKEAKSKFNEDATTILNYFAKEHSLVYGNYAGLGFWKQATVNKTFEMVKIFGPALYEQSPNRVVNPSGNRNPFVDVLEQYLNYVVRELDLRRHCRMGIDEALIKGMGVLWTELDRRTGLGYSHYVSCDDILIDPDARTFEDRWWIARIKRIPLWEFKRLYPQAQDVRPNGISESSGSQGDSSTDKEPHKDMVSYWEIYSQMGDGLAARGTEQEEKDPGANENVMIVIVAEQKEATYVGSWPTPYWADVRTMGWPCSLLEFAREPNALWPVALLKPALPIQKWLDWAYSFLLRKVAATSRDIVAVNKRLDDKQKEVIKNTSQADLEIMYLDDPQLEDVKKVFQVIQFPAMGGDILAAIEKAEMLFDKVTGLNEILYGFTPQAYRSAREAEIKDRNSRLRIDDYGREVVEWNNVAARHEAICARWHLKAGDIAQILGPEAGAVWDRYQEGDLNKLMREYTYSIESGSMRPIGPQERREDSATALQTLLPVYMQAGAFSAANRVIVDWAKARQMKNVEELMIPVIQGPNGQPMTPAMKQAAEAEAAAAAEAERQQAHDKAMQEGENDADAMTKLKIALEQNASKERIAALKATTDLTKTNIMAKRPQAGAK